MAHLTYQPIRVSTGTDRDEHGVLAMVDGYLVAVLVRLEADIHGEDCGHWHHEAGFGRFDGRPGVFDSLTDVTEWIAGRLGTRSDLLDEDGGEGLAGGWGRKPNG